MIKDTKIGGFTAIPLDYEAQDGDLSTALGVVSENGSICPLMEPSVSMTLQKPTMRVVCVHETSVFHYYIIHDTETGEVYYTDQGQNTQKPDLKLIYKFGNTTIYNFATIGNTLLVLTEKGMHYFLWKSKANGYILLGTHLPECPISFGLQTEVVRTDKFDITFEHIEDHYQEFSDDNKTNITSQVLAKVNKFIAEEATNKGRFIFPFFVRYAYRLYDGTLTMHSAPILMIAASGPTPLVICETLHDEDAILRVAAAISQLDYNIITPSDIDKLKDWDDIIHSVDIFISKPIYKYDQSGKCKRFVMTNQLEFEDSYSVGLHTNQNADPLGEKYPLRYQKHYFTDLYMLTYADPSIEPKYWSKPSTAILLPTKTESASFEEIRSCAQFFLLKSFKAEELSKKRTIINIPEDYLQSLTNREVMTDDYDSHDTIVPKYPFIYNYRLNVANISKKLFDGYNAGAQLCYTNGYTDVKADRYPDTTYSDRTAIYQVYVVVKQDGKDITVMGGRYLLSRKNTPMIYLYYPNVKAYKAYISIKYSTYVTTYEVHMQPHNLLNGAVYFEGWEDPKNTTMPVDPSLGQDCIIDLRNKIYTSEVNNPFLFPTTGINTVGTGNILGICAAVKALSQGQFGQFPLYAFSTDGVWALEVSSSGSYSAKQPVTREVCTNSDSITQMDTAVLFATNRGIIQISGSTAICITDAINNEVPLAIPNLPYISKVVDKYKNLLSDTSQALLSSVSIIPFTEYIKECRMAFDYTHQRIIVYNTAQAYAYVYSLKTQQWGMMLSNITYTINSYPDALAMDNNANVVNISAPNAKQGAALIITRPFKLDDPNTLKTIDTLIVRGTFRKGHVQTVLYGSVDLYSWHLIASSVDQYIRGIHGTPYKYFRLALVCHLEIGESVYSFTTQYTPRLANRPR